MIDTHCHLTFPEFRDRVREVADEAARHGVSRLITISTTVHDAADARVIARSDPRVFFAAGVHPLYADKGPHDWAFLRQIGSDSRCVAWGELGLDNHYSKPHMSVQREVLLEQLESIRIAAAAGLARPIVVHCREAFADLIPVLRESNLPADRFVFHCFTGTPADMRAVLDFGSMVSFTGVATYLNAPEVREAAKLVPIERMMLETDAPFLSPEPMRSRRPCEPWMVSLTARSLAELRAEHFDHLCEQTDQNARRFFALPD